MINRREQNAEIFKDTERRYQADEKLKSAVKNSIEKQKLILANEQIEISTEKNKTGKVIVSGKRTLEASESYAKQGKKVCIHNFASATNPGGGVTRGSSAQEEAICRCSTLYPCLNTKAMWDGFYGPHRAAGNPLYNDDCIFTPSVKVFKSDTGIPKVLQETDWWDVDVITCAAPYLNGHVFKTDEELLAIYKSRIRNILEVAISKDVDCLILGAFGCGAFRNNPDLMAKSFADLLIHKQYATYFEKVVFAIKRTGAFCQNLCSFEQAFYGISVEGNKWRFWM